MLLDTTTTTSNASIPPEIITLIYTLVSGAVGLGLMWLKKKLGLLQASHDALKDVVDTHAETLSKK